MAVDMLQEKIRKLKNPTVLELCLDPQEIPSDYTKEEGDPVEGYTAYALGLLNKLKELVPAVWVNFASFALYGPEGLTALKKLLQQAKKLGYYALVEAPQVISPRMAARTAELLLGQGSAYPCDGIILGGYSGSDVIKPFLPFCQEGKKDIYLVVRTGNKSAPELQDLLAGGRLVHAAAADHVNRFGADTMGKFGYTRVGILAGASSAESLKNLRKKYPKLFFLIEGVDYPNANAKNCAQGFDKFGHGAAVISGSAITGAWKQEETDNPDALACAEAAALRLRKNLNRYVTIL